MGETIAILILEKDRIYRDGLRLLIEKTPDFSLVAEVDTAIDALNFSLRLEPDVVIMDSNCSVSTVQVLKDLRNLVSETQVLIFSNNQHSSELRSYLEAGASGYFSKGQTAEELVQAIRLIALGNVVIDKGLTATLKEQLSQRQCCPTKHYLPELTQRENQIVSLLAQGLKNRDIAARCSISEKTVRNHMSSIFSKLEVANRQEAMLHVQTFVSKQLN